MVCGDPARQPAAGVRLDPLRRAAPGNGGLVATHLLFVRGDWGLLPRPHARFAPVTRSHR